MSPDKFVVAVALLSIIGCAPDEIALVSTGPLDDLVKIPQDATAFAETGGPPILEVDERRLREFEDYWYGPWKRTEGIRQIGAILHAKAVSAPAGRVCD